MCVWGHVELDKERCKLNKVAILISQRNVSVPLKTTWVSLLRDSSALTPPQKHTLSCSDEANRGMPDVIVVPVVRIPDLDTQESCIDVVHNPSRLFVPNRGESVVFDEFGRVERLEVLCRQNLLHGVELIIWNEARIASKQLDFDKLRENEGALTVELAKDRVALLRTGSIISLSIPCPSGFGSCTPEMISTVTMCFGGGDPIPRK